MRTLLSVLVIFVPLAATQLEANVSDERELAPQRQFDFWIGEWSTEATVAQDWDDVKLGQDTVSFKLDGTLIEEIFLKKDGVNFQRGYLTYLPGQKIWHHTIYDSKWGMYLFEGGFEDGKMVLMSKDKRPGYRRETFYNIEEDSFDYLWEGSSDGKNWQPVWKVKYRRKASA